MNTVTTSIRTTVILEFISAAIIRMVAKVDMDAYGLKQGQVFYCAYSESESKAQGKNVYHVIVWNYTEMRWTCPCKAVCHNCKHVKAVAKNCSKKHSLQGYKPASKAEKFAALMARYDVRNQPVAAIEPCKAIVEAEAIVEQAQQELPVKYCDRCHKLTDEYRVQGGEVLCEKCIGELDRNAGITSDIFAEGHPFVGWKVSVTSHGSHGMPGHPIPALEAARGSLASSSRHMEMAPSGRMVFMR